MNRFPLAFGVIAVIVANGPIAAVAEDAVTPSVLSFKTKVGKIDVAIAVEIDDALKAHPSLGKTLLAEGKRYVAKWRTKVEEDWRRSPKLFADGIDWSVERTFKQRSVVGRYVSVLDTERFYTGGAHGSFSVETTLWDRETRKRISTRPFFKANIDDGRLRTVLAERVRAAVARAKEARGAPVADDPNEDRWLSQVEPTLRKREPVTLAPSTLPGRSSGLTFHFAPYQVGSYAEGPYTVFVPWTDLIRYISGKGGDLFGGERPTDDAPQPFEETAGDASEQSPFADINPDELIAQTPGFTRVPESELLTYMKGKLVWQNQDSGGVAWGAFAVKVDGEWLYVIPLVSGGSAGVFTALLYRWSDVGAQFVQVVKTKGYAEFFPDDGMLIADDREGSINERREIRYGFDASRSQLVIKSQRSYRTEVQHGP
ncbi:MAG: DUF3298 domain-containing protein [Rhizobiales bacterium]|nr:DUF3298 domain-containing protein [Hyphomicrobiales bacterium]